MRKVNVSVSAGSYDVLIGSRMIDRLGDLCREKMLGPDVLLISNPTVYSLYGDRVEVALRNAGMNVLYAEMGDGEAYKTLPTVIRIYDRAIEAGMDRGALVIGLGGGVVTDVAGFVAATFMRGLKLVQVPTTLLAQVDAAIGGKVGVNHRRGKNLIGTFYQPQLVVIDPDVLETLPGRELAAGMAEVIKYGLIWDAGFYSHLCEIVFSSGFPAGFTADVWEEIISRSCEIKGEVVSRDEKENGLRAILNFGHTIGHGLEAACGYGRLKHGEAVSIGMMAAALISVGRSGLDPGVVDDLRLLLTRLGLPVSKSGLPADVVVNDDDVIEEIGYDKKHRSGELTFVLLKEIGRAYLSHDVGEKDMRAALERL